MKYVFNHGTVVALGLSFSRKLRDAGPVFKACHHIVVRLTVDVFRISKHVHYDNGDDEGVDRVRQRYMICAKVGVHCLLHGNLFTKECLLLVVTLLLVLFAALRMLMLVVLCVGFSANRVFEVLAVAGTLPLRSGFSTDPE